MSRFKTLTLTLIVSLSSVVITMLIVEGYLAIAQINAKSFDRYVPGAGSTYLPEAYYRHTKEGFSEGYINSHGFRDYKRTYEKPLNTFRILVLGDSYVEALQVPLDKSFPAILEKTLNESSPSVKFEVLNLGQSGFGTADEYMRYQNFGVKYNPDLVILAFLTGNDFQDNSKILSQQLGYYFIFDKERNLVLDDSRLVDYEKTLSVGKRFFQAVKRHSYLASLVSERIYLLRYERQKRQMEEALAKNNENKSQRRISELSPVNIYRHDISDAWKDAFAITKALINKFRDAVEANGSQFVLMTLSNAEQVHPELQKQFAKIYGVAFDFEQPERLIEGFARKENITYLKLMPMFREYHLRTGKYLHGFDGSKEGHWNEHGHRLAAEKIFEFLKEKHLVPLGSSMRGNAEVVKSSGDIALGGE